jgi:hypothetical protein
MRIYRLLILILILTTLMSGIAFASDISNAQYSTTVQISNNGTALTNAVSVFNLSTADMISGNLLNGGATDSAMVTGTGGSDIAFMPGWGTDPWCTFVSSIGASSSAYQYLYSKGATGGKLAYFPGTTGMSVTDSASLEPLDDFDFSWSGFVDTTQLGRILWKEGAISCNVTGTGEVTATVPTFVATATGISTGVHTIRVAKDVSTLYLYIDGVLKATAGTSILNSVMGTSTTSWPTGAPYQRFSYYANTKYWCFYTDGTNMGWRTSSNASTWSAFTTIRACDAGYQFSVAFDGTHFHYVYSNTASDGDIFYRMGTANNDGSITWLAVEQTVLSVDATHGVTDPSIAVDSNGYPWIAYGYWQTTAPVYDTYAYVCTSTTKNGLFTTPGVYQFSSATFNIGTSPSAWCAIAPLASGKMYFIVQTDGTLALPGYEKNMKGRLYNAGWGAEETPVTSSVIGAASVSIVPQGDDVHISYAASDNAYVKRTYSTGLWSSPVSIGGGLSTLTIDNAGTLLDFWINNPTTNHIYYKKCTNGVWDTNATDWLTSAVIAQSLVVSNNEYNGFIIINNPTLIASPYDYNIHLLPVMSVPDNSNNWQIGSANTTLYFTSANITIGGSLKGSWAWQYGATFTDLSGNGNTATPTFRTTNSDSLLTATITAQSSTFEGSIPSGNVSGGWTMVEDIPTEPADLLTEGGYNFPLGAMIRSAAITMGQDPTTWLFTFAFALAAVVAIVVYSLTHIAKLGQKGSLLLAVLSAECILIYFYRTHTIPALALIPLGIIGVMLIAWRKSPSPTE